MPPMLPHGISAKTPVMMLLVQVKNTMVIPGKLHENRRCLNVAGGSGRRRLRDDIAPHQLAVREGAVQSQASDALASLAKNLLSELPPASLRRP